MVTASLELFKYFSKLKGKAESQASSHDGCRSRGLVQVQQKPWLAVFGITAISDVTDEANAIVRLSGNDGTIFEVRKGILGVEKVVILGSMTAEDLSKVDAAASSKGQDIQLSGFHTAQLCRRHCRYQRFAFFFYSGFLGNDNKCLILTKSMYRDDFVTNRSQVSWGRAASSTLHRDTVDCWWHLLHMPPETGGDHGSYYDSKVPCTGCSPPSSSRCLEGYVLNSASLCQKFSKKSTSALLQRLEPAPHPTSQDFLSWTLTSAGSRV